MAHKNVGKKFFCLFVLGFFVLLMCYTSNQISNVNFYQLKRMI